MPLLRSLSPAPVLVSFSLVALALGSAGCGGDGEGGEAHAQAVAGKHAPGGDHAGGGRQQTIPVAVEPVVTGTASSYYTSTASLEAENHARILARMTGVVRTLLHEEGDYVAAGETLLLLEDAEATQRTRQAEANLRSAQSEHARRQTMLEGGLLSDGEFETTVNNLHVREAEFELSKLELSYTQVTSPIEGRVVRRHVDLGTHVTPGVSLFEVMDIKPLLARVHVPAKRMGFVEEGQDMEIELDSDGTMLTGVVRLVSPIVDPATGTVKVTAEILEYPPGTRPGDFAHVQIVTARNQRASLVPSRAIFEEQGENVLYVVEGTTAHRRVVETGYVDGDMTEILGGVDPGELIAVKGQRQLREGIAVEILEGPPEVLAAAREAAEAKAHEESEKEETSSDSS